MGLGILKNAIPGLIIQTIIFVLWFIAIPVVWIATYVMYQREKGEAYNRALNFSKNRPFFPFGAIIASQSFPFTGAARCRELLENIIIQIGSKFPGTTVQNLDITDRHPNPAYTKSFKRIFTRTPLNTEVSFIFNVTPMADMLYLRWWVLARGRIRSWEVFWYVLFAPFFSFAFWIIPWLNREYSILGAIGGDIEYSYDVLDIDAWVVAFQQAAFDEIIDELEKNGVDVERYREHPPQLNVTNISGSGNVIGSVAQGSKAAATGTVNQAA